MRNPFLASRSGSTNGISCRRRAGSVLPLLAALAVIACMSQQGRAQGVGSIQDMLENLVTKAGNVNLSTAINLAGRQRMLIQKMSKEACFIALGIRPEENRKQLEADIRTFETTLRGLRDGNRKLKLVPTRDPAILDQIAVVERMWRQFRSLLLKTEGRQAERALAGIAESNMPLLAAMNKVVLLYEKRSSNRASGISHAVNLAGRQRMLTQKMTKEVCFIALGIHPEKYRRELQATAATFDRVLGGLLEGDPELHLNRVVEPAPRQQLLRVQALWKRFRPLLKGPYDKDVLNRLYRDNLVLLQEMDKAVRILY